MIGGSILILMFGMLAIGMPVGFAMATSGALGLLVLGGPDMVLGVLDTSPLSSASSYELLTVPMFLLMAEFVIISGLADDLFKAIASWVGRVPGGLAIATAFAGAGFGAISGSSTAAAATLSATSIPAMLKQGYEPRLAGGVVAISGTLAMLIPPSVALVLYGLIADVSIGRLLIGGVVPGILVTLTIAATVLTIVLIDPSQAPRGKAHSLAEKLAMLRVVLPMLVLFGLVTGVLYLGVATPTEASALGALGALALAVWSGRLSMAALGRALASAAFTSCMIVMIVLGAKVFGYFLTLTQIPQSLVQLVAGLDTSRYLVLALILLGYLLLGCIMEQVAILILTVPVVLPVIQVLGFDPIWFGVLIIVVAEVGLVTPPVGLNVFVVARYTKRPLGEIFSGVMPHVAAHLALVALMVIFPQIVLWLPSTMR